GRLPVRLRGGVLTAPMVPPALDIPGLLLRFAARGDRPVLSFYRGKALAGRLSCSELVPRVELLAGAPAARPGGPAGDRVAILAPNRLEIPVLVLALLRLGAVVVPLNPGAAPEDWAYILEHSGAVGVAVSAELRDRLPPAAGGRFLLPTEEVLDLGGAA